MVVKELERLSGVYRFHLVTVEYYYFVNRCQALGNVLVYDTYVVLLWYSVLYCTFSPGVSCWVRIRCRCWPHSYCPSTMFAPLSTPCTWPPVADERMERSTLSDSWDCQRLSQRRENKVWIYFIIFLTRLWAPERGSTYCQGDLFDVVWWIQWRLEWPHTEWREGTTNRRAWSKGWGEKRRTLRFRSTSVQEG